MPDVGPASRLVPCATCGVAVDALRAPRVRVFDTSFWFFCSADHAELFDPSSPVRRLRPSPDSRGATRRFERPGLPGSPPLEADPPALPPGEGALALGATSDHELLTAAPTPVEVEAPTLLEAPEPEPEAGAALAEPARRKAAPKRLPLSARKRPLLVTAAVAGLLSVALLLIGDMGWALTLRTVVLCVGALALLFTRATQARDARQLDPFSELAPMLVAVGVALAARLGAPDATLPALGTAGLMVAALALSKLAALRVTAPLDRKRHTLEKALATSARRVRGGAAQECTADELRPGEEVVVQAGEVVPTDGTVVAGNAEIVPWFEAPTRQKIGQGAPVVAGARVVSGSLRIIAGWTGSDRAFVRLTTDERRRADLHHGIARAGYLVAQRVAPLAALLAAVAAFAVHQSPLLVLLTAAATYGALAGPGVAELAAAGVARGTLEALSHGIAFRSAEELDRAGRITVAALCARGTVLLGEPEVASIEPLHDEKPEHVLALAAGGEAVVSHPVATAVLRAARARGVRPDGTRNHDPVPGLGVTAIASSGKSLIVGSRALMLREKVSVALAERRITELEALGRAALLVAVDGRLVGILALQDGLRPGSRAAVQHLLDVGVEPVLLSGDSRETTEAVGRSIDIEHVRPELPAAQRGDEVRRLSDGGAVVAVVGRSPIDDVALGAADVSVALGAAAATNAEWSVGLVTEDVRDAARAIRIAHRTRDEAKKALAFALAPAGVAALTVAFGLLPTGAAPLAALLGALLSSFRHAAVASDDPESPC